MPFDIMCKKRNKGEKMQGKNVLVLGGLGFIGSNTAHRCIKQGANVTIYDALLPMYGGNPANIAEIKDKVKVIKKDMREKPALEEAVKEQDLIFNCAGQVSHVDSMADPYLDIDINLIANINLLEACRKHNDSTKIVFAGTRAEIGKAEYSPIDEKHPTNPTDIYGIDKLAAEKYHLLYNEVYGIRACSLRINNAYGERHQMKHSKYGILNWFIRLALEDKEIQVYGEGNQTRDYNYISDVIDAMMLAAESEKANGKFYLLGSGKEVKFIDLVELVIKLADSGSYKKVPFPEMRKKIEVGNILVSYEKIKKELGWQPKIGLEEGLKRTIEFYKQRLPEYI